MPLRHLPNAELCYFKKGEYLIRQGEEIEFLYYLIDGTIHRMRINADGKETIVAIKKVKDESQYLRSLIGVMILHDRHQQYGIPNCSFIARTDCICYRIPIDSYRIFEEEHKEEVLRQLLSYAMDTYQELFEMRSSIFHKNASALLCTHILGHITTLDKQSVFEKRVSKAELSKLLGIHPVNLSKIFSALIKQDILEEHSTYYTILDDETLESIASGKIELSYAKP